MPFVLKVVKDRHLRTRARQRRGEAGVQHHVEPEPRGGDGQRGLLPENARTDAMTRARAAGP